MTTPSRLPVKPRVWDDPRIVAPDADAWRAMSLAERDAAVERILAVFAEHLEAMSEGTRHSRPKSWAVTDLDDHFRRAGRRVFVASELAVMYPAEATIVPDVMAVTECDPDLELDSWVVVDRGRGVDVVIELRNLGRKHKDLRENVLDYARLKIPEYFSMDVRAQRLRGWRLGARGVYTPIVPQEGRLASRQLGLELAPHNTRIRFYADGVALPTSSELVARLQRVTDQQREALTARERERNDALQQRDDALDRISATQIRLIDMIQRLCERRGVALTPEQQSMLVVETEVDRLLRWLDLAQVATTGDALFDESAG